MEEKLSVKFARMTFKEKREYIWEYYNIHIIGTIIVLFFIGSMINSIFINPPKKQYTQLTVYGPFLDTPVISSLEKSLTELIVEDKDNYAVYISNFYDNPNDIEASIAIYQKFFAMIAAKELDVIIGSYDNMYALAYDGTLFDLTNIIDDYNFDIPEDDIITVSAPESEDTRVLPYAMKLGESEVLKSSNFNSTDYYIAILINSPRVGEAVSLIKCIMGMQ